MKATKWILTKLVKLHNRVANKDTLLMIQSPIKVAATSTKTVNVKEWMKKNPSYISNLISEARYDLRNKLAKDLEEDELISTSIIQDDESITIKMEINVYGKVGHENTNDGACDDTQAQGDTNEL